MIVDGPRRPEALVDLLGTCATEEGWRATVVEAAWAAEMLTPAVPARAALDAAIAETARDRATDYGTELFHQAVLLGFALARTWPAGPEGLDGWPRRALALAGIPTAAAADDDGEEHDR